MSAITPQTELRLIKCPLEEDNLNQLTFSNATAQYNYFNGLTHLTADNFTYQRKDSIIRYPAHIDDIISYNYVMYQNEAYTNKWFYAYITKMEYVNDNLTFITIKTDVFQTWQFDIIYKRCFTEREHVSSDTIGSHTVPEDVELGEYVLNSSGDGGNIDGLQTWAYLLHVTEDPQGQDIAGSVIGAIYGVGGYYCYKLNEISSLISKIAEYDHGRSDAIVNLYTVPEKLINGQYNVTTHVLDSVVDVTTITKDYNKPTAIEGYTPKNKKLLTYPYMYLLLSNGNGSSNVYHYELFSTNKATFELKGIPTVGSSMFMYPKNYDKGYPEEGIMGGKYPVCAWQNDAFKNWLTQNALNIPLGVIGSALQVVGGFGMLGGPKTAVSGSSSIANGLLGIAGTIGQIYQHSFDAPSAKGNTNGGDILTCTGLNSFIGYSMSIKQEYAKIIDDYFSMYGYKVNSLKIPNITGRTNWNYVKTIGCNFEGNIPQGDLNEIKNMFNTGVTLWHNPSTFLDYSQSNTIVT